MGSDPIRPRASNGVRPYWSEVEQWGLTLLVVLFSGFRSRFFDLNSLTHQHMSIRRSLSPLWHEKWLLTVQYTDIIVRARFASR